MMQSHLQPAPGHELPLIDAPKATSRDKRFPVAEIFGPTLQGEGVQVGMPAYFVRFGGCDYRCSWCDSLHAVLPEKVSKLPKKTAREIVDALDDLPLGGEVIVLSGGNPCLWDLSELVDLIEEDLADLTIAVETQGSIWKDWIRGLRPADHVVVSPKPPSSQMETDMTALKSFIQNLQGCSVSWSVKIVIFDREDYEWALSIADELHLSELYLSVGTVIDEPTHETLGRYKWLIEDVVLPSFRDDLKIRLLPQMHVLIWGHVLGV